MDFLRVREISKKDDRGFEIQGVSFTQEPRKNIAIAGETGSGKTTLLRMIAGLAQPDSGTIHFKEQPVIGPADKLIPGHKGIVYLSQHFELPNFLRVEQVLEYANEWEEHDARALFRICRIEHLFKRRTDQLSGGERQRIAIARLLIMAPELFLLDEPFSNTDPANKQLLKTVIADISREMDISFIMVSHEPNDTLPWADEFFIMKEGRIVERGSAKSIYDSPRLAYTAGLFGRYNVVPHQVAQTETSSQYDTIAIIRPEHVIMTSDTSALTGTIREVAYFGHYFECVIEIPGIETETGLLTLVSRTVHYPGENGTAINVYLNPAQIRLVTPDRVPNA